MYKLSYSFLAIKFYFPDIPEYDLLHAIGVPFSNPKTQYFDEGLDGFPAYGLMPGSDIKSPYRLFMPEKLYAEYSITATVRPANKDGGFLFSVVNPLETVVQLGVQLIPSGPGLTNISLLYTDANIYALSQTIASFVVPSFAKKWSRFALRVTTDNVTLFLNCHEFDTVVVKRNPLELVFDSASTLYVGQAGPLIRGAFHVSIIFIHLAFNNVYINFLIILDIKSRKTVNRSTESSVFLILIVPRKSKVNITLF